MATIAGRDFRIKEVSGRLCLVDAAGAKVFSLVEAETRVDLGPTGPAKVTATFFIAAD
jgi:hypothetical protein